MNIVTGFRLLILRRVAVARRNSDMTEISLNARVTAFPHLRPICACVLKVKHTLGSRRPRRTVHTLRISHGRTRTFICDGFLSSLFGSAERYSSASSMFSRALHAQCALCASFVIVSLPIIDFGSQFESVFCSKNCFSADWRPERTMALFLITIIID